MSRPHKLEALLSRLDGSRRARRRLLQILALQAGACSVAEACRALGIRRSQLYDLRGRAFQAALDSLEPRPSGRPTSANRAVSTAREIGELRGQVQRLERELAVLRARSAIGELLGREDADR